MESFGRCCPGEARSFFFDPLRRVSLIEARSTVTPTEKAGRGWWGLEPVKTRASLDSAPSQWREAGLFVLKETGRTLEATRGGGR